MLERLRAQPSEPAHPSGEAPAVSLSEAARTADAAKQLAQSARQEHSGSKGAALATAVPLDERGTANGGATGLQDESDLVDGQRPLGELDTVCLKQK